EPTVIEGKPGEKVTLELKNEGQNEHSFTVDSQGIDKDVQPGDEAEVTVMIPKSGVVSFYCKFHKSEGMAGALAVSGAATGGSGGMDTGTSEDSGGGVKGYGYGPMSCARPRSRYLGCRSWSPRSRNPKSSSSTA